MATNPPRYRKPARASPRANPPRVSSSTARRSLQTRDRANKFPSLHRAKSAAHIPAEAQDRAPPTIARTQRPSESHAFRDVCVRHGAEPGLKSSKISQSARRVCSAPRRQGCPIVSVPVPVAGFGHWHCASILRPPGPATPGHSERRENAGREESGQRLARNFFNNRCRQQNAHALISDLPARLKKQVGPACSLDEFAERRVPFPQLNVFRQHIGQARHVGYQVLDRDRLPAVAWNGGELVSPVRKSS